MTKRDMLPMIKYYSHKEGGWRQADPEQVKGVLDEVLEYALEGK